MRGASIDNVLRLVERKLTTTMEGEMSAICSSEVTRTFERNGSDYPALEPVSACRFHQASLLPLVGPSGCGRGPPLLRMVAGLDFPDIRSADGRRARSQRPGAGSGGGVSAVRVAALEDRSGEYRFRLEMPRHAPTGDRAARRQLSRHHAARRRMPTLSASALGRHATSVSRLPARSSSSPKCS